MKVNQLMKGKSHNFSLYFLKSHKTRKVTKNGKKKEREREKQNKDIFYVRKKKKHFSKLNSQSFIMF